MSEGNLLTEEEVQQSLKLVEILPGKKISIATLQQLLPDVETALFFAKAYHMNYRQVSDLLYQLFRSDTIEVLLGEAHAHSADLQDYIVDIVPDYIQEQHGTGHYDENRPAPDTELLSQAFESATVVIADSIAKVVTELSDVLEHLPSKYGAMTFAHLRDFNTQRNAIGSYKAQIQHPPVPPRLVVFDVSGSMTEPTVKAIVDEVVGLSYAIDASLVIVSNDAFFWEAGTFDTDDVLQNAQYWGTHYEMLAPVFDRDWDTVIAIADYDSSLSAKEYIRDNCTGSINHLIDVSLVQVPTFLSECLGQLARKVTPLLVGNSYHVIGSYGQQHGY